MKRPAKQRWIIASLLFAVFAAWAFLVANLIFNSGDRMIGFHPLILATLPGVIVGFAAAVFLLVCRQWEIGTALGLGVLSLVLVNLNGHRIEGGAWQRAIKLHARTNEAAMAKIQSDISGEDLNDVWTEGKLTPLEDFQWYGSNHISAPDGVYSGFRIGGIPHVRIHKIRHGWKGIALARSEADLEVAKKQYGLAYSRIAGSDWFTWSF